VKIDFKTMKKRYKILLVAVILILILFSALYAYLLTHDRNLMVVYSRSLLDIDDIYSQIAFNKQAADLTGEEIVMQKEPKINTLLEDAKEGKDVWNEIIQIEKEIDTMKEKEWKYREEYHRLIWVKSLKEKMQIIGFTKLNIDGFILISYPKEYNLESRLHDAEKEMERLEEELKEKKEELYVLYERGKKGERVVDDIMTLRSEIAELQKQYDNNRSMYLEIKVMFDTAFIVI